MKVGIFTVCHNSYNESVNFLDSVSASIANSKIELELLFIDNSSNLDFKSIDLIKNYKFKFRFNYIKLENLGYIPSIAEAIKRNSIKLVDYDYSIISNVDLEISNNFFSILESTSISDEIGVLAPSIYSQKLGVDRNPKVKFRPSIIKLKLNKSFFNYSLTFSLLKVVNKIRLTLRQFLKQGLIRQKSNNIVHKEIIYAAHGSIFILTREFSKRIGEISYPVFLFCEELYFAEMSRARGLKIQYRPELLVYDNEHASTSKMKTKYYRRLNVDALSYILKHYYTKK